MHPIDYTIVVVNLLTMVLVGLWLQKKASAGIDSYFLGNRSIPWWALGTSGMSSNLDITGTMINTALLFALGMAGFFIEIRGGVTLVMAFLMIFMGKWNRRAEVMTLAEWMHLRFGKDKQGDAARIIAAVGSILLTIAMVTYFCKGAGKFVAEFLGIPAFLGLQSDFWAALIMITLAMIYTVASGLYGVVWTDFFQSLFIFFTIIIVCYIAISEHALPEKFKLSSPVNSEKLKEYNQAQPPDKQLQAGDTVGPNEKYTIQEIDGKKFVVWETSREEWTDAIPKVRRDFPDIAEYSIFNMLGVLILFYLIRVTLEGCGGLGGYMSQRFFAVASDREAGLMSLFWIVLLSFRWPFIVAIAIMGISFGTEQGVVGDPELVLPTVINNLIPIGLKGLLVAGLMAAAMSTFDSTVNAGASYWVKDIYQAYLKPDASQSQLLWHSRIASLVIVLTALIFSLTIRNINEIWGWITMGIGAGFFVPQVVRWYWWRLNGWGFALGTLGGMLGAFLGRALLPENTPEYVPFTIVIGSSLITMIVGTFLTKPTPEPVLLHFYKKTRPFGIWKHVREQLPETTVAAINKENRRDIISTFIAVPWQVVLFLNSMMIVLRRWDHVAWSLPLLIVLSVALYFIWFRHLSDHVKVEE